jgi:hypothetical protein
MNSTDIQRHGPTRALLVIEPLVLAGIVTVALNHSRYITRLAPTVEEVSSALVD